MAQLQAYVIENNDYDELLVRQFNIYLFLRMRIISGPHTKNGMVFFSAFIEIYFNGG